MPTSLLKKQSKLTKPEFEQMKQHTIEGYNILSQIGAQHIAYLALSHHERADGSGYPQGLKLMELPLEVRVLQLVDMYSAITSPNVYRQAKSVIEGIRLLFQDQHLLDEQLLQQFVDFIGIYPEHSFVLLSDGSHATVEKVNELYPLLPTVRTFQTGEYLTLPLDFQLTIQKLVTYRVDTPDELFRKFSDYLINFDESSMIMYYSQLKEHYKTFEWFTHLYIPTFQIFRILEEQKVITAVAIEHCHRQLKALLMKTVKQLLQIHQQSSYALIMMDEQSIDANAALLLEGMLHTEGVYSIVLPYSSSAAQLEQQLSYGHFSKLIVLGDKDLPILGTATKIDTYSLTKYDLEKMLFHLSSIRKIQVQVSQQLEKYRFVQPLIQPN